MDVSLVTSLYRAEAHLDAYRRNAEQLAAALDAAGVALEIVVIANDPTDHERQQLQALAELPVVRVLDVPRETLYASWNRGFRAASGHCVGPWNVDDQRTAAALIEGHRLILDGCAFVYFPYTVVRHRTILGTLPYKRHERHPALPFDRDLFTRSMRGASLWMCSRELYERVGPFDEHFRIAGDFEWVTRAVALADFCPGTHLAGEFHLHGGNLSDTGNPLQAVEDAIVHLRGGHWEWLTPAPPDLLRSCWEEWGDTGIALPPSIQDRLWGPGASEHWQTWQRKRRTRRLRKQVSEALRALPRLIIDHTGLRPWLARRGIVKSPTRKA